MYSLVYAPSSAFSSLAGRLLVAFSLSLLVTCPALAQGSWSALDATTPTSLAPGAPAGSYALSGFDNVNLYNGNLNFTLPLLKIGGRGAAGHVIQLPVEVNWIVRHIPPPPQCGPTGCQPSQQEETRLATPNGWNTRPRYGLGSIFGRNAADPGSRVDLTGSGGNVVCTYYTSTLTRLTYVGPDGTEFEMHDQLNGGKPMAQTCQTTPLRGKVFVTRDGTSATFISDTDIYDGGNTQFWQALSGYLITSDGTRRRVVNNNVVWVVDRNGNKLTATLDSTNQVTAITDSMNRQVTITYATSTVPYDTITFKGYGGAARTIRIHYDYLSNVLRTGFSIQTFLQLFPNLNGSSSSQFNPGGMVSAVELPDGRQYTFKYNSYAELARVDLPTGGHFEYDFLSAGGGPLTNSVYHELSQRRVYLDATSTSLQSKTDYSPAVDDANGHTIRTVDQRSSTGTLLSREKHYFHGVPYTDPSLNGSIQTVYASLLHGREYKTEAYDDDGTTLLRKVEHTWTSTAAATTGGPSINPRVTQTLTTLSDTNQVAKQTFSYDQYNNRTEVKEYNYGAGAAGSLVRRTLIDYMTTNVVGSTTYNYDTDTTIHLRNLPEQISVYNAAGVEQTRTFYEYDNYTATAPHAALTARTNISGLDSAYTTSKKTRGNVTAITRYLLNSTGGVTGSVSTYQQYDVAGNVVKAIDGENNATSFTFADSFGGPDADARINSGPPELVTQTGTQAAYAYPSIVTNAMNQKVYAQRDYYTGQVVNAEDPNGTVSSAYYDDLLDRPTKVVSAANDLSQALTSQKTFTYDDTARVITTTNDLDQLDDPTPIKSQVLYDGLGRTIETRQYETATVYVMTKRTYDALGRLSRVSNPYRTGTPSWTETAYDALGRVTSVKTLADNAAVTTSYSGNTVTVTDQAGKDRQSTTDALGRLIQVVEDPGTGGLGYVTAYAYDQLDNLKTVTQGTRTRSFTYDSLSRLVRAANPESGTVLYNYDANGNLVLKIDPRPGGAPLPNCSIPYAGTNVASCYEYDALNRPTLRDYNDATPDVRYVYDAQPLPTGAPAFTRGASTGRLVAVTTGGTNAGSYYGYDGLGRVLKRIQRTDSINYLSEATYNKAGAALTETYPAVPGATDRRTISYNYDGAGRLLSLNSGAPTYAAGASVTGISYTPHGALDKETLGNGFTHDINYNARLQPSQIRLGTTTTPTSLLDLTYNYGTTNNNGNVLDVTEKVGAWTRKQVYTYDELNRLDLTEENNGTTTTPLWTEDNEYDRFGNRWEVVSGGTPLTFNSKNQIVGYVYDAAGNLTDDTVSTYGYDAENRLKAVGTVTTAFTYDGEGKRVRKDFPLQERVRFVYGISGQLVMEINIASSTLKKEYVYGADGLLATIEPGIGTRYLTSDPLGTPRVVTGTTGTNPISRHDYTPFGKELVGGVGGRTSAQFFDVGDDLRKKFTGYERDDETGLDFANARYYGNSYGRFTSPDPYNIIFEKERGSNRSERKSILDDFLLQPQNWNAYVYVINNPTNLIDPSGLIWLTKDNTNFMWIDDGEYERNKDKYKDYSDATGAVVTYESGTGQYNDPSLNGRKVVLGPDGDLLPITNEEIARATVTMEEEKAESDNSPIGEIPLIPPPDLDPNQTNDVYFELVGQGPFGSPPATYCLYEACGPHVNDMNPKNNCFYAGMTDIRGPGATCPVGYRNTYYKPYLFGFIPLPCQRVGHVPLTFNPCRQ